jgi:hypothetical protein
VFGAKRLSVLRYLKQNNETKIAGGYKPFNKVFAVINPERNVNSLERFNFWGIASSGAGVVLTDGFQDSRAALCRR